MSIQLENFTISRLVIHEIYKRDATGAVPPALNNSLADLDARGIAELQTRIVEAVGHGSHSITMVSCCLIKVGSIFTVIFCCLGSVWKI